MQIAVDHATFTYPNGTTVLKDISFAFEGRGVLAVLGANGAGKTTLLKCLLAFERWQRGCTRIDGVDIRELKPAAIWSRIGYVAQARLPNFSYTVRELVVLGRSVRLGTFATPGKDDYKRVERVLDLLGIADLQHAMCHEISGGQYQLALIARALVSEPQLLIFDEPESNLDYKNQLRVLEVIEMLAHDGGIGAIVNTHYPSHAMELADQALVLYPDRSYAFGAAHELLTEAELSRSFDVPVRIVPLHLPERPRFNAVAALPEKTHQSA